jgi:hypothetical protein
MKRWLVVLISLGFAVMSGNPALAGGAMHGRGPGGSFDGFGGSPPLRVGTPAMRLPPAAPGLTFARHGVTPAPRTAAAPVVPELDGRGEIAPAIRSGIRPVEPRMVVIDSSAGARAQESTGSATAARPHPVPQSAGPKVLIVSDTIGSRSVEPKTVDVNPTIALKPFRPKVIVAKPFPVSRHRGRTVLGIAEGAQRTTLLLGSPCDLGVSWVESCAPVDSALLIVEAAPEDAQVFLDGQLLGTAGQLAGQVVVVAAGPHALAIVSPPAEPFTAQFTAKPGIPTRIHVALAAR